MNQPIEASSLSTEQRDAAYHMHGYTDAAQNVKTGPLVIDRGEGVYVFDNQGRRYIEAMAGLWSAAVGFNEPRLVRAATRQMEKLPFYHTFSHKSHGPLVDLAEKLVSMAPVPMSKVFFTNSGSEANDTALKLIWYRSNALGQPKRKKVISRIRGYHGVTVAAASLTGLAYAHNAFDLPIAGILHTACPHYWRDAQPGESEEAFSSRLADELEQLILREGPDTIAAFFGEPLMGAGGVVVPPAGYWQKVQTVLRKYDILLIADEVICGFGRTGNMFGSQTFGISPDMMVLSKQLSSSYLPISALLMNDRVFEPVAAQSHELGTFGHGLTAGGHPVAAAVALENIRIIEERNLVSHAATVGTHMRARLQQLADHPLVGEVRGIGLIAAVELVGDKASKLPYGKPGELGRMVNDALIRQGVISRAMGDAIAFCPPMIIQQEQVDEIIDRFTASLDEVHHAIR
ncbi:aspartate aminotransferase family protein [Burkholderia pseudomallei]|uniref:aspartate aminotransferase family protein n=1 Tax=Burkholderia pseudomallei TaxID=28450 RepID=UPI0005725DA5|nr:aspartate aminotransferase family protein [Burkholderia pseudomallei]AJX93966.1 aminotransferase class-III family protein [Burkholderia pseudomallei PB08298010]